MSGQVRSQSSTSWSPHTPQCHKWHSWGMQQHPGGWKVDNKGSMGSPWSTSASEVRCPVLEAQHALVRREIDVTDWVIPMDDKALFCCKFFCFFSLSALIFLCKLMCTCLKVLSPQGIKLICDVRLFWWQEFLHLSECQWICRNGWQSWTIDLGSWSKGRWKRWRGGLFHGERRG